VSDSSIFGRSSVALLLSVVPVSGVLVLGEVLFGVLLELPHPIRNNVISKSNDKVIAIGFLFFISYLLGIRLNNNIISTQLYFNQNCNAIFIMRNTIAGFRPLKVGQYFAKTVKISDNRLLKNLYCVAVRYRV
jgi:hypothetical protein